MKCNGAKRVDFFNRFVNDNFHYIIWVKYLITMTIGVLKVENIRLILLIIYCIPLIIDKISRQMPLI